MNVLLVDIGTPREEINEPIGIELLATYVEREFDDQVSITLKSLEIDDLTDIESYIKDTFYSVIGISTKIRAFNKFKDSVEIILALSPQTLIVVGDILGTYAYEEILSMYENIICVRGEGEIAFTEIIREVLKREKSAISLSQIPNLAYMSNGDLKLTQRQSIDLTNNIPPKRYFAKEVLKQNGIIRVEASRGCSYSLCNFCGVMEKYCGPGWRPFDVDFVIQELITLSELGFKSPYFTDEDFYGNDIPRIYELANRIIEAKQAKLINPEMNFFICLRAHNVAGKGFGGEEESIKLLRKLKEAGFREIFIGLESGSKSQLKRFRKCATTNINTESIRILKSLDFEMDFGFIFFDPDSDIPNLRDNIDFICDTGINYHDSQLVKRLRIEPRTPLGFKYIQAHANVGVDLNLVEHPYSFRYSEVGKIYQTFLEWQKEDIDVVYNLQSFCRGEIPSGYSRSRVKDLISKYRNLDLKYLDELVKIYEFQRPNEDEQIKGVTKNFKEMRKELDNLYIDKIKWLNSNFRRTAKALEKNEVPG